jgi:hypothetical protein
LVQFSSNLKEHLQGITAQDAAWYENLGALLEQSRNGLLVQHDFRTRLLWWKESCYSPSLKQSYRKLHPYLAAVVMAADLAAELPPFHPQSVEYFLREAVLHILSLVAPQSTQPVNLVDWCNLLAEPAQAGHLQRLLEMQRHVTGGLRFWRVSNCS